MKNYLIVLLSLLTGFVQAPLFAQTVTVCQGQSLQLSTPVLPGVTQVEWFKDGQFLTNDPSFVITEAGTYTLQCESSAGCISELSDPLVVIVNSLEAFDDNVATSPSTPIEIPILVNDQDHCYAIDNSSAFITATASNGTATCGLNGTINYTPNAGFLGIDTFYYIVHDVNSNPSNVARVIITVGNNSPLPIVLGDFIAIKQGGEAQLLWNTHQTSNASHFEIERSHNGRDFSFKGKVTAPTNSTVNTNYTYWDKNPLAGKNYYRLKLVDLDGKSLYSETRVLEFGGVAEPRVYPNPAKNIVFVDLAKHTDNASAVQLTDLAGRVVLHKKVSASLISLNMEHIASATYFLKVLGKNNEVLMSSKISKTE